MTAPFPFNQVTTVELPNRNDKLRILFPDYAIKPLPHGQQHVSPHRRAQQIVLDSLHAHGLPPEFNFDSDCALIYSRESVLDPGDTYLDVRLVSLHEYMSTPGWTSLEDSPKTTSKYLRRALIEINNERKVVWYRYVDIDTIEYVENGIVFQTHYKSIVMHLNADGSVEAE